MSRCAACDHPDTEHAGNGWGSDTECTYGEYGDDEDDKYCTCVKYVPGGSGGNKCGQ